MLARLSPGSYFERERFEPFARALTLPVVLDAVPPNSEMRAPRFVEE